jgi:hypothetical protein
MKEKEGSFICISKNVIISRREREKTQSEELIVLEK